MTTDKTYAFDSLDAKQLDGKGKSCSCNKVTSKYQQPSFFQSLSDYWEQFSFLYLHEVSVYLAVLLSVMTVSALVLNLFALL